MDVGGFKQSFKGNIQTRDSNPGPQECYAATICHLYQGFGKSNFMDAISFVLGEKTSKLRVKKMEDLIHTCTNPLELIKKASVEATFTAVNNGTADYETLIFARIIKQSSSTFFFNNQSVSKEEYVGRLKTYGMNIDFPNFLVFQGDIAKIALQNPEELRRYFEYIVGSTSLIKQYDQFIEENKVLYNESQILSTQKKNMNQGLIKDMSSNKEYKMYMDAKKDYDDKIRLKELICFFYLDKAINDLVIERNSLEAKILSLDNELEGVKQKLAQKREQQKETSKEVSDVNTKLQEEQKVLNENKLHVLRDKQAIETAENAVKKCKHLITLGAAKAETIESNKKRIYEKIREVQEKMQTYPIMNKTEEQIKEYRDLTVDAAKKRGKLYNIDNEEREDQTDHDNMDTLRIQLKGLENFIKINQDAKEIVSERLIKLNEKHAFQIDKLNNANQQRGADDICRELRKQILTLEEKLLAEQDIQGNIDESKRDQARKDIFMKLKELFEGVYDRVTNCCNVKTMKYKIPLTKVVGNKHMNAIIVDTEVTARECIKYLKMVRQPPETFLPINYIKVQHFKKVNTTSKSLILLKNVLAYDPRYENIMSFICKGTYVCEDPVLMQQLYKERINVIDLEGSFYQRSGLLSGGVADLAKQTHRWIKERDSQREVEYNNLMRQVQTLRQELVTKQRQTNIPVDIEQLQTVVEVIGEDIKKTEKEVANLNRLLTIQNREMEKITNEIGTCKTKIANREAIVREIKINEREHFEKFCKKHKIEDVAQFENMEKVMFNFNEEIEKLRVELANEDRLKETLAENMAERQAELPQIKEKRRKVIENHKQVSEKFAEVSRRINDLEKARKSKLRDLDETDSSACTIEKDCNKKIHTLDIVRKDNNKIQNKITKHKQEFNAEYTRCNIAGIEIPLIESSQESQETDTDYYNKIKIDYEEIPLQYRGYKNIENKKFRTLLDQLCEKIRFLQRKIQVGNQYLNKHGKGRDEQIESLREKVASLEELHGSTVRRYHKTKQDIKTCAEERNRRLVHLISNMKTIIKPMYADLTGDTTGNVFLEIQNTEHPFAGGINFNVICPEKIYMPLDNLSGGELTMAGILLLLTIQKYSRCPILILDEIDAPLDPTNAVKLFKYLGKISEGVQIFLITHNAEVYRSVELLIGFTKNHIQESVLKSKVLMLSCEQYEQNSFHESDLPEPEKYFVMSQMSVIVNA